jgi:hypothetical protein
MMMGWGIAAMQRRQIRLIATGIIGLGLFTTTILPSAIGAEGDAPGSSRDGAGASYTPDDIKTQISGLRTLLLNETSALQKQTSDIAAALQKQTSDIGAALRKQTEDTGALQKQTADIAIALRDQATSLRSEINTVRTALNEHVAAHPPPPPPTPPESKPPIVKKIVHIYRHYYRCCEPCWYW